VSGGVVGGYGDVVATGLNVSREYGLVDALDSQMHKCGESVLGALLDEDNAGE